MKVFFNTFVEFNCDSWFYGTSSIFTYIVHGLSINNKMVLWICLCLLNKNKHWVKNEKSRDICGQHKRQSESIIKWIVKRYRRGYSVQNPIAKKYSRLSLLQEIVDLISASIFENPKMRISPRSE